MELIGDFLLTAFAFVFVISVVVVFHELGHYWAGRWCGVHAEAFSMGFGPTLFSRRDKNGTVWRVAAFPLGGYVRFLGDAGAASEPDQEKLAVLRKQMGEDANKCFHFKPVWQRAIITGAGPVANFILSITIFAVLAFAFGATRYEPIVGEVIADSAAEEAGVLAGDRVLSINDSQIEAFEEIMAEVVWRPGEELQVGIERGGERLVLPITPRRTLIEDQFGGERPMGVLGIRPSGERFQDHYNPVTAIGYGVSQTGEIISMTVRYVSRIVTGRTSPELLNGPLGIVEMAGQRAQTGAEVGENAAESAYYVLVQLIHFCAVLSVGLGLVNLLPLPILDGGHLMYYAYEAVVGRPLSAGVQAIGFRVGLALVLGMMLVASLNDLNYKLSQFF
ncbi:RIP metalloprotease RseP [Maricaulis sp. D1M11]|uniref:RIP metalloprotease RseP n=1 Tax=Maricaulis sp. D1M11 TaxID=3076117 RepID=UPI0039B602C7